jgi:hypothetical protein
MGVITLTSKDTIKIRGRVMEMSGDGDVAVLTFPNELNTVKVGKNGNAIVSFNEQGRICQLDFMLLKNTADDRYLNSEWLSYMRDPIRFVAFPAEIVRSSGDGQGNVIQEIYLMSFGVPRQNIDAKSNVEGDTEQAKAIYKFTFVSAPRIIS